MNQYDIIVYMKALYRRYRPMKLDDVVGQEQVTKSLGNSLKAGKVGHAYLFIGPRGCGKTSVARILAHEVNGFKYELEDDYVDIIEIDGASNRGIDDIRELREKVTIAPTSGKYKVYIIDEVHMLTTPAFNALLKTLEEPPKHVIFIMAPTYAYKIPATITSRSQIYTFKLAEPEVMLDFLRSVADQEKIKISNDALRVVAKRGGGSFRDSMSLLDQISTLSDKEITKEMVVSAMGLPKDEKIQELLDTYATGDVVKITTLLKDLLSEGIKAETLTEEMVNVIIDNPRAELLLLLEKLPEVKEPFAEAKLLVALCSKVPAPSFSSARPKLPDAVHASTGSFDWDNLLGKIEGVSEVVHKQLAKCEHEMENNTLHLYPRTKIVKNILDKPNNKKIIVGQLGNMQLEIHEAGGHPKSRQKDETLDRISGIMGGEVINDGGDNPF